MIYRYVIVFVLIFTISVSASNYCFEVYGESAVKNFFGITAISKGNVCIENIDDLISGSSKEIIVTGDCVYSEFVFDKVVEVGFVDGNISEYSIICKDVPELVKLSRNLNVPYYGEKSNGTVLLKIGEHEEVDLRFVQVGDTVDLKLNFLGKSSDLPLKNKMNFETLTLFVGILFILVLFLFNSKHRKWLKSALGRH